MTPNKGCFCLRKWVFYRSESKKCSTNFRAKMARFSYSESNISGIRRIINRIKTYFNFWRLSSSYYAIMFSMTPNKGCFCLRKWVFYRSELKKCSTNFRAKMARFSYSEMNISGIRRKFNWIRVYFQFWRLSISYCAITFFHDTQ